MVQIAQETELVDPKLIRAMGEDDDIDDEESLDKDMDDEDLLDDEDGDEEEEA